MEENLKEKEKYRKKTEGELLKARADGTPTQKDLHQVKGWLHQVEEKLREKDEHCRKAKEELIKARTDAEVTKNELHEVGNKVEMSLMGSAIGESRKIYDKSVLSALFHFVLVVILAYAIFVIVCL